MSETKEYTPVTDLFEVDEIYGFQISDVEYMKDYPQYEGPPKDTVKLKALILNEDGSFTENPEFENQPFQAFVGDVRKINKLTFKNKEGATVETNLYRLLSAMGLDPDPNTRWEDIDFAALKGMFGRADVTASKNKRWLQIPMKGIKPLKNKDHIAHNKAKRDSVFTGG